MKTLEIETIERAIKSCDINDKFAAIYALADMQTPEAINILNDFLLTNHEEQSRVAGHSRRLYETALQACHDKKELARLRKSAGSDFVDNTRYPVVRHFEPKGPVFKRCLDTAIVIAEIMSDSSIIQDPVTNICRASKVKIVDLLGGFYGQKIGISIFDQCTRYSIGDIVNVSDFNPYDTSETAHGFFFFKTLEEAKKYY